MYGIYRRSVVNHKSLTVMCDVKDEGSGVAILSSVRTETGYKAKWWIRLQFKPKSKRVDVLKTKTVNPDVVKEVG